VTVVDVWVDGASKGNPGDAGIGVVVKDPNGELLLEVSEYIGKQTNNVAEYAALLKALSEARLMGASQVRVFTDSELMAHQINGLYQVKSPKLRPKYEEVVRAIQEFERVTVSHVPRERNCEADKLASRAAMRKGCQDTS
jgi:ribonuclease HI